MSWTTYLQTTDDGVDFLPYDANDHPTLEEVVHHYTGIKKNIFISMFTPSPKKASGGFNDTFFHESEKYGRLAFRISKDPIYTYRKRWNLDILFDRFFNTKVPETTDLKLLQEPMGEIVAQTEKNWLIANEKKICPRIIYYGYIKYIDSIQNLIAGEENKVQLKSCLITEAYDNDLNSFYYDMIETLNQNEIIQLNKYVCRQLVELIDKYVESNIVCSDIKPENVVIKIVNNTINSSEDIQVRLIDLDGDFCKEIKSLPLYNTRMQLRSDKDKYKILLCIIMANHFFYYIDDEEAWDVFNDYFTKKRDIFNKREDLRKLFEGELETMCKYYFEKRQNNDGTERGHIDPDKSIFDVLFDNVVLKPEPEYAKSEKSVKSVKLRPTKSVGRVKKKSAKKRGGKSKKSKKLNKTKKSKK